jgi:hypothetical protein
VVAGLTVKLRLRGFIAGLFGLLLSWVISLAYLWAISPVPPLLFTLGDIVDTRHFFWSV